MSWRGLNLLSLLALCLMVLALTAATLGVAWADPLLLGLGGVLAGTAIAAAVLAVLEDVI